ncbi:MAG TPA: polyprenyl diphosphate synthase [Planctomycetota bacterium]|nr:polyprenyl diphosphate synthase [Planctomycetota bacterium]
MAEKLKQASSRGSGNADRQPAAAGLPLPRHIAIIMDGNGRWAVSRGKGRTAGHRAGIESVKAVLRAALDLGLPELTLYAFSTENWKRPRTEVSFLMRLLRSYLAAQRAKMIRDGVRLGVLGDVAGLPAPVRQELDRTLEATAGGRRLLVNLALNYGSREEIARAARLAAADVAAGRLAPDAITAEELERRLYTAGHPDPDLVIRTAGEMRMSNFLLWQSSYAEFWVTPVLWPDFRREHLEEALADFGRRQRRFGGLPDSDE